MADLSTRGARRRRELRKRSWWHHEQVSVPAAVAAALQQGAVLCPVGTAPGPQRSDRTVRRSTGDGLPLLASRALAGAVGEAMPPVFASSRPLHCRPRTKRRQRRCTGCCRSSSRCATSAEADILFSSSAGLGSLRRRWTPAVPPKFPPVLTRRRGKRRGEGRRSGTEGDGLCSAAIPGVFYEYYSLFVSVCCLGELFWIFPVLVLGSSGSRSHNVFRDGDSDLAVIYFHVLLVPGSLRRATEALDVHTISA